MKRISILHVALVIITFISVLRGGFPRVYDRPEIIPYKLVPSFAEMDVLTIEIIEPNCLNGIPKVQKLQETGHWILNDVFWIDDRPYILIKIKENF